VNSTERIVIPHNVLDGFLTAIYLQLKHPTFAQLKAVCQRYLYALYMDKAISAIKTHCHECAALKQVPLVLVEQSTSDPPEVIGSRFTADVIKRALQCILVVREHITSFTWTSIIPDEKHVTLRDGIIKACIELRPLEGPPAVMGVDPAPGFQAMHNGLT